MNAATPRSDASGALALVQRVLFVVQAAIGLALAIALTIVLAGILPTFFGYESFTVYSGSMEPSIKVGSLAVVKPVPTSQLRTGDIVTYRMPLFPDVVVTHRLIGMQDAEGGKIQFRTKGDANEVEDLVLVEPNAVLGKVTYSVPYAGYLVEFSKGSTGRLILIGLPALLLLVDYLRQRARGAAAAPPAAPTAPAIPVVPPAAAQTAYQAAPAPHAPPAPAPSPYAPVLAAQPQSSAYDLDRSEALLARGREALAAGRPDLATRAADGVLAVDPRSERGWLLKAQSAPDRETRLMLLRTALALNPGAPELQSALWLAESQEGGLPPGVMGASISQASSPPNGAAPHSTVRPGGTQGTPPEGEGHGPRG